MTAREAAKRLPGIDVLAFDPGYVPHTGLGRDNGRIIAALVSLMKSDRTSTIPRSGQFLADLALGSRYAGARGDYWSVRGPALLRIEPSTLARDDAACSRLWDESARLVLL